MTPTIKLRKSIIKDTPRDLVCYVELSVLEAVNIDKEIFVVTYVPPTTFSPDGYTEFFNVAYVDQLSDVPTVPEHTYKSCRIRSSSVKKSFPNTIAAETWCSDIWKEIQRLLSTLELKTSDGDDTLVTITTRSSTESEYTDRVDIDMAVDVSDPPEVSSESSVSSEPVVSASSVSDNQDTDDTDYDLTIDLTFDGKEVIL